MRVSTAIVLIAIIVVTVLLIGRFNFSEADFSMSNPAWNGMTKFSGNNTVNYLYAISDLSGAGENNTLLIVGPTRNYSEEESTQARMFMERGGTIIVLDDFGTANTLLRNISSPITLYQKPICDYNAFYKRQSFPIISNITNLSITAGVSDLVLNHPATINITGNATILANTSNIAWIDENANLLIDGTEKFDVYPVVASTKYGKGELIVASEPDIISNVMYDKGNNSVFAANIFKTGTVYLDVSHGYTIPPFTTIYYIVKYDLVAQLLCSLLLMLIGYIIYRRRAIKKSLFGAAREPKPANHKSTIIAYVKAKLPVKDKDISELNKKL